MNITWKATSDYWQEIEKKMLVLRQRFCATGKADYGELNINLFTLLAR